MILILGFFVGWAPGGIFPPLTVVPSPDHPLLTLIMVAVSPLSATTVNRSNQTNFCIIFYNFIL